MEKQLYSRIKKYCQKQNIISRGDRIVAGLSGGADSVFLADFLAQLSSEWHLQVCLVHVNHGIRGEEAYRDEEYCVKFAQKIHLPLEVFHGDVPAMAAEWKMSEEEAGRKYRYNCFNQVLKQRGYEKIAVAHHEDDQGETVLFQLMRGSSLKGLGGMRPVRDNIIRPLLCVRRMEIENSLKTQGITWCTDSTNLENIYSRNQLRNQVIPYLEKNITPTLVPHISQTASQLQDVFSYVERETLSVWERMITQEKKGLCFSAAAFEQLDVVIQRELAMLLMERTAGRRKDLTAQHVEAVRKLALGHTGKRIHLPYEMVMGKDYDMVWIHGEASEQETDLKEKTEKKEKILAWNPAQNEKSKSLELILNGEIKNIILTKKQREELPETVPKNVCTKWFDYARIDTMLEFRHPQEGDYFFLDESGHRKKLNRYLMDQKIPADTRAELWVLAMKNHVVWIPQLNRVSAAVYVTANTKTVLEAVYQ